MLGDFPIPDLGFDDDACDPAAILFARSPSKAQTLTKDEAQELSTLHGLVITSEVPLRCTSNSSVYVASSTSDDRVWAVKVTTNRRRVQMEYTKRSELPSSPFLVETIALWEISAKSILQMEFCRDGDITRVNLTEHRVWQMINHVGAALHEIHAKGWMHLDVSPGNVLQDDQVFKLADFGTLTKIGEFTEGCEGAGPYVSAEALAFPFGRYAVTGQTDIFSFGVVLLECLSGLPAPRGGTDGYARLRRGEIRLGARPYECTCSEELALLVRAMMNIDPNQRPTAHDLVERSMRHC
jgi:serine/threonine protein kinase